MVQKSGYSYDATLEGICERVTYTLGDAEAGYPNQTWEKDYIRAIVCDGIWALAEAKSDLFPSETIKIPLVPNSPKQELDSDDCEKFLEFICIEDSSGRRIPVTEARYDTVQRSQFLPTADASCRAGQMATVPSITVGMSKTSNTSFMMTPMFYPPEQLFAVVKCRNLNPYYSGEKDLPENIRAYVPAIVSLALYFALGGDRIPGGSEGLADMHFNNFMSLSQLTMQQENHLRRVLREDAES